MGSTSTSRFKTITGGDPITAERKFAHPFTFQPFARLLFSANEPPGTPDGSFAYFRRWLIVPFDKTFIGEDEDKDILEKLTTPAELSGFLNLVLVAYADVLERGAFTSADVLQAATNEFRTAVDPASAFLSERTTYTPDIQYGKTVLYRDYRSWCGDNGRSPLSAKRFNQRVSSYYPSIRDATIHGTPYWTSLASLDPVGDESDG